MTITDVENKLSEATKQQNMTGNNRFIIHLNQFHKSHF